MTGTAYNKLPCLEELKQPQ